MIFAANLRELCRDNIFRFWNMRIKERKWIEKNKIKKAEIVC